MLGDLIGDLTWSPNPVEIKIFSTNTELLKTKAAEIAQSIEEIPGVVDVNEGLGRGRPVDATEDELAEAARTGLTPRSLGTGNSVHHDRHGLVLRAARRPHLRCPRLGGAPVPRHVSKNSLPCRCARSQARI